MGDFNLDGKLDLVTANFHSNNLTVLLGAVGSQTISFDAIPNKILGISPFVIAAQSSEFLPVTIAATGACTNTSNLVMVLSTGTCSITASASGNAAFNAAPPAMQSFTVVQANTASNLLPAPGSPDGVGAFPYAAAVGDFNEDGIPDIVTANLHDGDVTVSLGNGSGGFPVATSANFAVDSNPVSVAVGDFNGDGHQDVAVVSNTSPGSITVLLGNGTGLFSAAPGSPFVVGNSPESVVVGDFNGDGIQDLAIPNYSDNTVTVLMGNGSGGFFSAGPLTAGTHPVSIAVGDFNRDGFQDLAIPNAGDGTVTVYLGNAVGSFTLAAASPISVGTSLQYVAVGDFNLDGTPDLALAGFNSNDVTVLLGDGTGGFTAATGSPFAVGSVPFSLAVGDYNGDGKPDIAVANSMGSQRNVAAGQRLGRLHGGRPLRSGNESLFRGVRGLQRGWRCGPRHGKFRIQQCKCAAGPRWDGIADHHVRCDSQTVFGSLTLRGGRAVQRTGTCHLCLHYDQGLQHGEQSGQGADYGHVLDSGQRRRHRKLQRRYSGNAELQRYPGGSLRHLGHAASNSPLPAGNSPGAVVIRDFNGDGFADIAIANSSGANVTVLLGSMSGAYTAASGSPFAVGSNPVGIVAGDFNGDGKVDLATVNHVSNNLTILLGDGTGNFSPSPASPITGLGAQPVFLAIGDFNGDGIEDLATANSASNNVTVLLGNGTGGFTASAQVPAGSEPFSIAVGDFNGDLVQDLAVANGNSGNVTVLLGNGSGGFSPASGSPFATGSFPDSVVAGDFNGDGNLDLATANFGDNTVTVLLGVGTGSFSPATSMGSPVHVWERSLFSSRRPTSMETAVRISPRQTRMTAL